MGTEYSGLIGCLSYCCKRLAFEVSFEELPIRQLAISPLLPKGTMGAALPLHRLDPEPFVGSWTRDTPPDGHHASSHGIELNNIRHASQQVAFGINEGGFNEGGFVVPLPQGTGRGARIDIAKPLYRLTPLKRVVKVCRSASFWSNTNRV